VIREQRKSKKYVWSRLKTEHPINNKGTTTTNTTTIKKLNDNDSNNSVNNNADRDMDTVRV